MIGTFAVAAREIAERKLLFLGAFVVGLLPLGFPLAPVLRENSPEARSVAVLFLTAAIAVGFPLAFGSTILASDIVQKRLSFYFSRPLSAAAIWAGKLLGALVISIGCTFLVAAPVFLVEGESAFSSQTGGFGSRGLLALVLPGVLLLVLLAHVVASMARLRSAWIVLDFILAVVLVVAIAVSLRSLFSAGFWNLEEMRQSPDRLAGWLIATLVGVLLAASCVQVTDGRTDTRRSHGALSATLWGLTSVSAAILGGLAWWASSARATDLARIERGVLMAPRGPWVAVGGPLRAGRGAGQFLFDTEGGRSVRVRSGNAVFSANGARAAWTQERIGFGFSEKRRKTDIYVADLASAKAVETGLTCSTWSRLALSASGRRLALLDDGIATVYDVSDPSNARQLVAVTVAPRLVPVGVQVHGRELDLDRALSFVDEDLLRLFPRTYWGWRPGQPDTSACEIVEISLLSKKSLVTGRFEREALPHLRLSADGRYFVGAKGQRLTLHDGRTGTELRSLESDLKGARALFISGGRIAVAGVAEGKGVLKIFLEGEYGRAAPARTIDLGPAGAVALGGEIAPDHVAVSLNPFLRNSSTSSPQSAWKLAFVDVAAGTVSPVAVSPVLDGLVPADRFTWWFSPLLPPAEAGSPASRLFLDASGALVRFDPTTMKQEVLLGGRR
ncbi:MAG TPA: hypothetical protein VLJ18_04020 [Thermoanaerobaculia bacterium]|nr:hypothetical protein [Thermoanaerobaculia bacterium]